MGVDLTMKTKQIYFTAIAIVLFGAQPALANQPPGAQIMLAEILILPIMALLSLLGGAYAIINRQEKKKRKLKTVIAIVVSGINEGLGVLVALVFGIYALIRGFQMLLWGIGAQSFHKSRAHLAGANPLRLIAVGVSLILITLFLTGMAVAFVGYWPEIGRESREKDLKQFVTYQLAYARWEAERTGQAVFRPLPADNFNIPGFVPPDSHVRIEYSQDGNHFTVYMLPTERIPFSPFNYLTSQPSYRADETGRIRMIRVNRKDHLCPADAPVVMHIGTKEIQNVMKKLFAESKG